MASIVLDPSLRQPWPRFLIKALLVIVLIVGLGAAFSSRYRIGIDSQVIKCIPGKTFYLVDLKDKGLERDSIYAFRAYGVEPFFDDGRPMVKYMRGEPGDTVRIDSDQTIYVNGKRHGWGLYLAEKLDQPQEAFMGEAVLEKDQYWFMGLSDLSFDSRYWGAVNSDQIMGRAYPLF